MTQKRQTRIITPSGCFSVLAAVGPFILAPILIAAGTRWTTLDPFNRAPPLLAFLLIPIGGLALWQLIKGPGTKDDLGLRVLWGCATYLAAFTITLGAIFSRPSSVLPDWLDRLEAAEQWCAHYGSDRRFRQTATILGARAHWSDPKCVDRIFNGYFHLGGQRPPLPPIWDETQYPRFTSQIRAAEAAQAALDAELLREDQHEGQRTLIRTSDGCEYYLLPDRTRKRRIGPDGRHVCRPELN